MSTLWSGVTALCWLLHSQLCTADLFTSTHDMQEAMATEALSLEDAHYFLSLEESRLDRAAAQHRRRLSSFPRVGSDTVLGKFIRTCRLYALQADAASAASMPALLPAFAAPSSRKWWPADRDVTGAADGLCKLQRVYEVPVTRIAAMRTRRLPPASAEDLSYVARGCYANGTHGNTTVWSRQALAAALNAGSSARKLELGLWWLRANDARRAALEAGHRHLYPAPPETDVQDYKSVCAEKGDLRTDTGEIGCVLWTGNGDPRLILGPLKLEVLSLTPRVAVFVDFLTASEVAYIQQAGRTGLERGSIYDWDNPDGITSYKRISKVSWLWDADHPSLAPLARRISLATGLSLESAEPFQVANYGLGGHYTPHDDASSFDQIADEWDTKYGNRLATVLLYLSDVSLGGATAFVNLHLAVKPRRGAALFWHDLAPYSGSDGPVHFSFWHQMKALEDRTNHVGCPVLWGTKWIATKWIREHSNVVVRFDYPG
ncbi:prolyl 4-hydroxylase subunit alpha-2-like [Dermacentor albipictus]|uniref:prolyl 4-hydroxylase subunit alpha-2-like n=1 Tax=Dermacentor albipictus TaxID=60249 RepID=UPI0031FD794C